MNLKSAEKELRSAINEHISSNDVIAQLAKGSIIIYGAGNYGQIICKLLMENGVPRDAILGFLDAAAEETSHLEGLPVYHPENKLINDQKWKEAEVIISIYCSLELQNNIKSELYELGYNNVQTCYNVAIAFHIANNPKTRISKSNFWQENIENIVAGCRFWGDELSLQTYVNHFLGYLTGDVNYFLLETSHQQYFAPPPLRKKGYERFIDCGAFDGDTIRDLVNVTGKIETLVLFEPCEKNFQKLCKYIREKHDIARNIMFFPCGVWEDTKQLQFNDNNQSASTIAMDGNSIIQCVAIDDAVQGIKPTFIKMDIEGAEPKALEGAAITIKNHKPDLAISVYHSLAHFWEIPKLVCQFVPEYRLYLRTYGAAGFETIMYAVAEPDDTGVKQ